MKTIARLLRSTLIFFSASTGGCLEPDDDMELELRAGEGVPCGGHDCDCPDCWAISGHTVWISLDHEQIESINDNGGLALLRTELESKKEVRFFIMVPPDVSFYDTSFELETGIIRAPFTKQLETPISMLGDAQIDEIALFLDGQGSLRLLTSGNMDHALTHCAAPPGNMM